MGIFGPTSNLVRSRIGFAACLNKTLDLLMPQVILGEGVRSGWLTDERASNHGRSGTLKIEAL